MAGTSILMKQTTEYFSGTALTTYLNQEKGTTFRNLPEAITNLGVGLVTLALVSPLALEISKALGLALALQTVIDTVEAGIKTEKLQPVLDEIGTTGTLEVTTSFYEWISGSGNHTAYYTEEEYRAV